MAKKTKVDTAVDAQERDGQDVETEALDGLVGQDPEMRIYYLGPHEIQAPSDSNSRRFQTSRDSLVGLAMSMLEDGQQQPVKVALMPDGTYALMFGFRRWQAACMINEEKLSEKPFMLQAIVVPHMAESHLISGVIENAQREAPGLVDQAYAIQRMMSETNLRQTAIARKLGITQSMVSKRLRLLELPVAMQKKVNRGEVPADLAIQALALPEGEERDAAVMALAEKPEPEKKAKKRKAKGDAGVEDAAEVEEQPERAAAKIVRPKTSKQLLAELEEYATPEDDAERTKAQTWVMTRLIPWIKKPTKKFRVAMEALEEIVG